MIRRAIIQRMTLGLTILATTALANFAPAAAERMVISISRHQVLVSSSFTGTSIVLFGTIEPDSPAAPHPTGPYDLVVTVTGPRESLVTRRKERVLGIWANTTSRLFVNVPTYLAISANRAFDAIGNPDTRRRLQIGLDYTLLPQQIGPDLADVVLDDPMRANFVRLKKEQGLYQEEINGVTFLTPTVFRSAITLPAISPVGSYEADIKLIANGQLISRTSSAFEVVKVGFEQFVATAARDHGFLYGLATVAMALLTGWMASVVFRRD